MRYETGKKEECAEPGLIDSLFKTDFWIDIPAEVKQAIQKAKDQLDCGEGIPHQQVMGKLRERYLNK